MSKILYSKMYEREGNDSWLEDYVEIAIDPFGDLILNHKLKHNGWQGELKENRVIELDVNDIEKSQKIIDEYIDNNSLYYTYPSGKEEGIKIDLKEIL